MSRLHNLLNDQKGINSKILFLSGDSLQLDENFHRFNLSDCSSSSIDYSEDIEKLKLSSGSNLLERNIKRFRNRKFFKNFFKYRAEYLEHYLKLKDKCEIFSSAFSDYPVESHELINWADVINLHWVSGFINPSSFFQSCTKPIVWTMHDMNAFLGSFHYENDLELLTEVREFELHQRSIKINAYKKHKNLNCIFPSQWLLKKSQKYEPLNDVPKRKIHNPVSYLNDMGLDKDSCRKVLGVEGELKVFLMISQDLNNYRKGTDRILKMLSKKYDNKFTILMIGKKVEKFDDYSNVVSLGFISDDYLKRIIYSAADYLLLPSREDNLPNTMIESLLCNTPVISFNNGGMSEILKNQKCGYIVKNLSEFESLFSEIVNSKKDYKYDAYKEFRNYYSQENPLQQYIEFYHEIKNKN